MKYIAKGYQYAVYDLHNGKVLKKPLSPLVTVYHMFWVYRGHGLSTIPALKKAVKFYEQSKQTTLRIRASLPHVPTKYFANPVFKKGITYEQDRVTTIDDYLISHSFEENKVIIDQYIQLTELLWSYGIHDYVFKIKSNYGVDATNNVVLLDFNEINFSLDEALISIQKEWWRQSSFYKKWPEDELKKYYTRAMEENCTEQNLRRHWNKSEVGS